MGLPLRHEMRPMVYRGGGGGAGVPSPGEFAVKNVGENFPWRHFGGTVPNLGSPSPRPQGLAKVSTANLSPG